MSHRRSDADSVQANTLDDDGTADSKLVSDLLSSEQLPIEATLKQLVEMGESLECLA